MNITKNKKPLIFTTTLLSFIFVFIGFRYIPQQLPWVGYMHWGFLLTALAYLVTPLGGKRITPHPNMYPKLPILRCFSSILALEIALLIIHKNMTHTLLMLSATQHVLPHASDTAFTDLLTQYGLFPWGMYAVLAVRYAIHCCNNQQDTYPATLCLPSSLKKQPLLNTCQTLINISFQQAYYIAFSIIIATLILQTFVTVIHSHQTALTQINWASMLIALLLIVLCSPKRLKKYSFQFKNKIKSLLACLLIFIAIIITILSLLSLCLLPLISSSTTAQLPFITPANAHALWNFLSIAWWLGLTGLVSPALARLCAGYTLRQTILVILILPLCLVIYHQCPFSFPPLPHSPLWLMNLLFLAAFIICFITLFSDKKRNDTLYCMLSKPDQVKPRSIQPFTNKLLTLSLIMTAFTLPLGFTFVLIGLLSITWLVCICLLLCLITPLFNAINHSNT